jgi:hypothetical protein
MYNNCFINIIFLDEEIMALLFAADYSNNEIREEMGAQPFCEDFILVKHFVE